MSRQTYATANGSATAGSDYAAASGNVTIAAGQTAKTFTVAVIGDRSADLFGNSSNSLFTKSRGLGTILNDD